MDGLFTKMQITGADSKSIFIYLFICRELINGIDDVEREKRVFNSTKTDQNELITYLHT